MSQSSLFWKIILILVVVGLAALFSYPPKDRVNLGLDLRGGAHILMQIEPDSAVENELSLAQSRIAARLKDDNLTYASIVPSAGTGVEIRGTDPDRRSDVRDVLDNLFGGWDVQDVGSGSWRVTMPAPMRSAISSNAIQSTLNIVRNRIDALGVADPIVQQQGIAGDRILIQLPGVEDPTRVKDIITIEAMLEWKVMTYPPQFAANRCGSNWVPPFPPATEGDVVAELGGQLPEDTKLYPESVLLNDGTSATRWWPLKRISTVQGNDLRNAYRSSDEWGDPTVAFELTQDAGRRFETATRENTGCIMAIVLDGNVISAPVIESTIRDQGIIRGGFDITGAEDLALQLKSGAIPVNVDIIEERTVGPSLGRDSIRSGLAAGITGFVGVMLFMLIYYRLAGVNAVVALALNVVLVFGTLGALPILFSGVQATLTLPGIAGLILTVGMAVDSNVLIFERIREELRVGKTVRAAVENGFGKALVTILDCNVTTLVAAFFLFSYGTGPVKGFAVTLTIGLLASMFTAVFVSRQLFELLLNRRQRAESLSI
jgi:preprotein translocase subunit SecD